MDEWHPDPYLYQHNVLYHWCADHTGFIGFLAFLLCIAGACWLLYFIVRKAVKDARQ